MNDTVRDGEGREKGKAPRYWFLAKRYGWGWGLPGAWEGWATLAAFFGLMAAASYLFPPERDVWRFAGIVLLLVVALLAVCWLKGEPPRWRWGGTTDSSGRNR